jgi:hypothetical protein
VFVALRAGINFLVTQSIPHHALLCFACTPTIGKNLRELIMVLVRSCTKGKEKRLDKGVKRVWLVFCEIRCPSYAKKRGDEDREGHN